MRIIFNFLPIKSGGGQQVAFNFVNVLSQERNNISSHIFIVTKGTHIHEVIRSLGFQNIKVIGNSPLSRFFFEKFRFKKWVKKCKPDLIFTLFGPNLPKTNIPSIVGCAYSNLFFPEIDFWNPKNFVERLKFKFIDDFRLRRTLTADGIIFENSVMRERVVSLFDYSSCKTIYIPPSISINPGKIEVNFDLPKDKIKILCLANWHRNKNIEIIPDLLNNLYKNGIFNVVFVISVDPSNSKTVEFIERARRIGVHENIICIGIISPDKIPALYEQIDFVMLLSLLESFSNNIIESWVYKRPLIISNLEWAIGICNEAALYVDRNSIHDICEKIILLSNDKILCQKLISNGMKELETYPNPRKKVMLQLEFAKKIVDNA